VNKLLAIAAVFIVPFLAFAQTSPSPDASVGTAKIDPEKKQLLLKLLSQTKEVEMAQERIAQAMAGMKQLMVRLPPKYWDKYQSLMSESELRDRLMQVYDKRYTTDEIKSLIAFYDTPAGKKMSENAVPILRDSMKIAQDMSRSASEAVMSEANTQKFLQNPAAAGSFNGMLLGPSTSGASDSATPAPSASP
jgi:hypothetical protein